MRTPTTNLDGTLEAVVSQSGWLAAITVGGSMQRLCSLDVDFTFDGYSWASADFAVQLAWDASGALSGNLTLGDSDRVWWSYALNLLLQDAPVQLWACDAMAPGEAEPVWSGLIGAVARGDQQVACTLKVNGDLALTPRRRVQMIVPSYLLAPPGTVIQVGAQQYVIGRQFDQGRVPAPVGPKPRLRRGNAHRRRR